MTTNKSMAPIARRKNPKDGSGITALPLLLSFAIGYELRVGGISSKIAARRGIPWCLKVHAHPLDRCQEAGVRAFVMSCGREQLGL